MEVVNGYYSVLMMSGEIDTLLIRASENVVEAEKLEPQFRKLISSAETSFSQASEKYSTLTAMPKNIFGEMNKLAQDTRNFLPHAKQRTADQINAWNNQYVALLNDDADAYDQLISNELDGRLAILEMANAIGRMRWSLVDEASPSFHIQQSIVLGNDVHIEFMRMLSDYSTSLEKEDIAATSRIQKILDEIKNGLALGNEKNAALQGIAASLSVQQRNALLAYSECAARALQQEGEIFDVLKEYGFLANALANESFDADSQIQLAEAEQRIVTLAQLRSALKSECARAGIAYTQTLPN